MDDIEISHINKPENNFITTSKEYALVVETFVSFTEQDYAHYWGNICIFVGIISHKYYNMRIYVYIMDNSSGCLIKELIWLQIKCNIISPLVIQGCRLGGGSLGCSCIPLSTIFAPLLFIFVVLGTLCVCIWVDLGRCDVFHKVPLFWWHQYLL